MEPKVAMPPRLGGGADLELEPTEGIDCGAGRPSRVRGPVYASFSCASSSPS